MNFHHTVLDDCDRHNRTTILNQDLLRLRHDLHIDDDHLRHQMEDDISNRHANVFNSVHKRSIGHLTVRDRVDGVNIAEQLQL